jgi:hypothetical protein
MATDLDSILRRVSAGELTPEEALPLIDAAQKAAASSGTDGSPEWGTPGSGSAGVGGPETETVAPGREGPIRDVRISISYRTIDVVADPTVAQVSVSGTHSVRREGDTLIVDSNAFHGFTEFDGDGPDSRGGAWSFMPRSTAWARSMKGEHVTVRVNPTLPVTMDSVGSSLRVSGCEGGLRIRLVAASLKLDRARGPLEIDAMTSSVKGSAAITGTSRISGESSSVKLLLLAGTDVRARAVNNRMGKIVLPGYPTTGRDGRQESVLGEGGGQLTVDGVMSSITLSADAGVHRASA